MPRAHGQGPRRGVCTGTNHQHGFGVEILVRRRVLAFLGVRIEHGAEDGWFRGVDLIWLILEVKDLCRQSLTVPRFASIFILELVRQRA